MIYCLVLLACEKASWACIRQITWYSRHRGWASAPAAPGLDTLMFQALCERAAHQGQQLLDQGAAGSCARWRQHGRVPPHAAAGVHGRADGASLAPQQLLPAFQQPRGQQVQAAPADCMPATFQRLQEDSRDDHVCLWYVCCCTPEGWLMTLPLQQQPQGQQVQAVPADCMPVKRGSWYRCQALTATKPMAGMRAVAAVHRTCWLRQPTRCWRCAGPGCEPRPASAPHIAGEQYERSHLAAGCKQAHGQRAPSHGTSSGQQSDSLCFACWRGPDQLACRHKLSTT